MSKHGARHSSLFHGGAVLACALWLAGCASGGARGPATMGLFHAEGPASGRLAPGPSGRWYVAPAPSYQQTGLAGWSPEHRPGGLAAFFARLFHRHGGGEATAVIDARSNLPLPSVVEVVNPRNGAKIRVRVEARANLGGQLIRLGAGAASSLGADPATPLLVRVRFAEPVLAYRDTGEFNYARLTRHRPQPGAQPIELASATRAPPVSPTLHPTPHPAPTPVSFPARAFDAAPKAAEAPTPDYIAMLLRGPIPPKTRTIVVQAATFAQFDNARRAASRLAQAGEARIVPTTRNGAPFYRVLVSRPNGDAGLLRARVAQIGFPEAQVRSFQTPRPSLQ